MKIIPRSFDERNYLTLVYVTLVRASARGHRIRITERHREQLWHPAGARGSASSIVRASFGGAALVAGAGLPTRPQPAHEGTRRAIPRAAASVPQEHGAPDVPAPVQPAPQDAGHRFRARAEPAPAHLSDALAVGTIRAGCDANLITARDLRNPWGMWAPRMQHPAHRGHVQS